MPSHDPHSLADIAGQFTAINPSFSRFHGKLFSFIPPDPQRFHDLCRSLNLKAEAFPNKHPATAIVGKLASCVPFQSRQVLAVEEAQFKILAQLVPQTLPDCTYLALISPAISEAAEVHYASAFESIGFLRAFLSLSLGKLPFYTWIADFDFTATGELALQGEVVRLPLYGDHFEILDAGLMNEIAGRLAMQQDEFRDRLKRACNFISTAMNQKDEAFRFSSYWIALEIIVGGKSDAIRSRLAAAYGERNKSFADEKLFYREIERLRHDLVHKGSFGTLQSYQERLMQLYFWDLVIARIGLKNRGLALLFAESGLVQEEQQHYK